MKKYFCDACKKEIDQPKILEVPCHLWSKRGEIGYIDSEFNAVSGRRDSIDLCNKCSNKAFSAALKALGL